MIYCVPTFHWYQTSSVYRVNWLRAKARYDRWDEELKLVKNEMNWVVWWFEHRRLVWEERSKKSVTLNQPGHRVYACKQIDLWQWFENHARRKFVGKMVEWYCRLKSKIIALKMIFHSGPAIIIKKPQPSGWLYRTYISLGPYTLWATCTITGWYYIMQSWPTTRLNNTPANVIEYILSQCDIMNTQLIL